MFDWSRQVILLTGGTGSFGQAFTKYLLTHHTPKSLRIYSRDEYKQYEMQQKFSHPALRYLIGDVRDEERLKRAMDGVTLVIHAAAMKQILAAEYNPTEAIKTNILGTMNVINVGIDGGVERIIGLITDKAVSPVNLYGATKLCMEKLLVQGNSYVGKGKTKISCVRYGNVAGSRGSVIPLFWKQRNEGLLTITHEEMTRFWITLEESVKFVIQSIEMMTGGEIFIPKMPSFRVNDLAHAVAPKAKIKFSGIRPGEKLHEDLVTIHEAPNALEFNDFYILEPSSVFWRVKKRTKRIQWKTVPSDFFYNSNHNPHFLTVSELAHKTKLIMENFNG